MKHFLRFGLIALTSLLPGTAFAVAIVGGVDGGGGWFFGIGNGGFGAIGVGCGFNSICVIANQFLFLINFVLVPLLFAVAFIVFLYGVFRKYVWSRGDSEQIKEGHHLILWGVVGFVVMISLWGIVNVVANTFGLAGYSAPPTPVSYPQ